MIGLIYFLNPGSFFTKGNETLFVSILITQIEVKMGSLTAIYFFVFLVCVGIIAFIMALEKIRKKDEEDF